jgi:hypothetical protein
LAFRAEGAARLRHAHRVEPAGLDRLPDRSGRRGGAHGAVRRDVVDLPAALAQARDLRRQAYLTGDGRTVVRFEPSVVLRAPRKIAADVRRLLSRPMLDARRT